MLSYPSNLFSPYVEVRKSPVHGLGVFAKVDIPKKTELCNYKGVVMSLRDFKELYGKDTRYTYSMRNINKIIVGKEEPYLTANISHYCNENEEEPNVILQKKGLWAAKDIAKGSELFLHYPKNYPRTWKIQDNNTRLM